ncbi:MAG: DUF1501 domain-containing protein [Isosphaeraceae bacterium]
MLRDEVALAVSAARPVRRWASALFPEINRHVDDLLSARRSHGGCGAHGPATLFLHCGARRIQVRSPSMGSWILYGLGSENANLPGFRTIGPSAGNGARNYGMPSCRPSIMGPRSARQGAPAEGHDPQPLQPRPLTQRPGPRARPPPAP